MYKLFKLRGKAAKSLKTCAAAVSLILLVSTGSSFAFTTYGSYQDVPALKVKSVVLPPTLQYEPSSAVTDSCLPLLKTIRKTSSQSVTVRNQRSAGKAAALGLIFGVRYALTPPGSASAIKANVSENQGSFDVWQKNGHSLSEDDRSAQAISAYRSCQKKQALSAMNDTRSR